MTDKIRTAPDTKFRPAGAGLFVGFLCARCGQNKSSNGRKLQMVKGLRTWVCAGCVK
jgi:hypothetical protein